MEKEDDFDYENENFYKENDFKFENMQNISQYFDNKMKKEV